MSTLRHLPEEAEPCQRLCWTPSHLGPALYTPLWVLQVTPVSPSQGLPHVWILHYLPVVMDAPEGGTWTPRAAWGSTGPAPSPVVC